MERRISHVVQNANIEKEKLSPNVITRFSNYLLSGKKHYSKCTVDSYTSTLSQFFKFMKIYKGRKENIKENLDSIESFKEAEVDISIISNSFINRISIEDLNNFIDFCEKTMKNSIGTLGTKTATLKSFYNYMCLREKIVKHNIGAELENVVIKKRLPVYMNLKETNNLLDVAFNSDKRNAIRNFCIINVLISTAIRRSELRSIDISKIRLEESTLTVIGKGDKERTVYLNQNCLISINEWIVERGKMDLSRLPLKDKDALFISENYNRISTCGIRNIVRASVKDAGLDEKKYTPHKLRHGSATLMYKYGHVDITKLKEILGHENISTTQIYTHVDDEQLHEAVESNPTNIKRVRNKTTA